MKYCVVPMCQSNGETGTSFHEFPSDDARREIWIKNISREGSTRGSKWVPNQHSTVCGLHFKDSDFKTTIKRRILKLYAVPTIFPSYPEHKKSLPRVSRPLPKRQKLEVCERHFKESDIETEASAYDPKTGRTITAPLSLKRLKKGVIPSLCIPKLCSEDIVPNREDPEEKRRRIEEKQLRAALHQSLKSAPIESSLSEDAAECSNTNLCNPALRASENYMVEISSKKTTKRKKKHDTKTVSSKGVSDVCRSNSVVHHQSSDIQEISQSNNSNLLNSTIIIQGEMVDTEQQVNNLSKNQISNYVSVDINEISKKNSVQIKEESPWEEEYNCQQNATSSKAEESRNNMEMSESCDTTFYNKPLKIDKRDETFGKFVACEMSDLRGNPELYLKTQQSILKLLIEAHFEQISSA